MAKKKAKIDFGKPFTCSLTILLSVVYGEGIVCHINFATHSHLWVSSQSSLLVETNLHNTHLFIFILFRQAFNTVLT